MKTRYGLVPGWGTWEGVPKVVELVDGWWWGRETRPGQTAKRGVDLPQNQVIDLGEFSSWEAAQAAAQATTYSARRRGSVLATWRDGGPRVVPATEPAEPGDQPLGWHESVAAARAAATAAFRASVPHLPRDQAQDVVHDILRYDRGNAPRGLIENLAGPLGATPARVTAGELRWEVSLQRWLTTLPDLQQVMLEEHYNPRAGTCCSRAVLLSAEEAQGWL